MTDDSRQNQNSETQSLASLKFTGRLTRQEMIWLNLEALIKTRTARIILFIWVPVFVAASICDHVFGLHKNFIQGIEFFFGIMIFVSLIIYIGLCFHILFWMKVPPHDVTVILTPDKVSIDGDGISIEVPVGKKVIIKKHRIGIRGYVEGRGLFTIPYRILSKDDLKEIEQMYFGKVG